jgi:hypothetical protein
MIGLFHSNWLGCQPGSVSYWSTAGRGRDGKIQHPPHYRGELRVNLAGFLNSAQVELSCDTHLSPPSCAIAPLFSRSRTNYFKYLSVTYTNITS